MSGSGTRGEIGLAVAILRMIRGWERADLVRAMGVSRSWISELERGRKRPSLRTLQRITDVLGFPMSAVDETLALVRNVRSMGSASGGRGGGEGGRAAGVAPGPSPRDAGLAWDETGLSGVLFELFGESLHPGRGGRGRRRAAGARGGEGGGGEGAGREGGVGGRGGVARVDAGYGLRGAGEVMVAESAEAARDRAAAVWTRLRRYGRDERHALVREGSEFQGWALCERLCEESLRADDPGTALELAELAVEVAQLATPAAFPGTQDQVGAAGMAAGPAASAMSPRRVDRWRENLSGYAWAFVVRARRLGGDPARAGEALARSRILWPQAVGGKPGELAGLRLLEEAASAREMSES